MADPQGSQSPPGMFTRKATGLVREIAGRDALIMNIAWVNLVLGVLIITIGASVFPGVSLTWGYIATAVVLIVPILVYALLTAAMPRSGGEYVYISRVLHPMLGFVASFGLTASLIIATAILSGYVSTLGLSGMFSTLGTVLDNGTLSQWGSDVTSDGWTFAIGVATILFVAFLNYRGLRLTMRVVRVFFGLALLGMVIAAIVMLASSRADFVAEFNQYGSYDGVLQAASAEGLDLGAGNSVGNMLGFMALAFGVLALAQMPAYAAGELRRPRTSAIVSMVGALLLAGAFLALLTGLSASVFGSDFLAASQTTFESGSGAYPDIPPPFFMLFASMLTDNAVVIGLMTGGVVFALWANLAILIMVPVRNVLAYSVDSVLPAWARKTHPRYHSPGNAVILVATLCILVLIPYVFGPPDLFNFFFSTVVLQAIVYTVAATAAILLPFRAAAVFASSPYNQKLGRVPVISILGAVAAIEYAYFAIKLIGDDRIGANATSGLVAIIGAFVVGVVIYGTAWLINRRRGVDLGLAYTELPPE